MTASLDDVVTLTQAGISDNTILAFLHSRPLALGNLDRGKILQLRKASVSERVIRDMLKQEQTQPSVELRGRARTPRYPDDYYNSLYLGSPAFPPYWYSHAYGGLGFHGGGFAIHRDHGVFGFHHEHDGHDVSHGFNASDGHSFHHDSHNIGEHDDRAFGGRRGEHGHFGGHSDGAHGGHHAGGHGSGGHGGHGGHGGGHGSH